MNVSAMTDSKKNSIPKSIIKMDTQTIKDKAHAVDEYAYLVELCRKWGATNFDEAMESAAFRGHVEIVKLCKNWGATNFDEAMECAALEGYVEIVKLCKKYGATNFAGAMESAAWEGHVEVVKLCKNWGATNFDAAMECALRGHVKIVKLCKNWGVTKFVTAMECAALEGHVKISKLCRGWLGYDSIHQELFRHHHKCKFSRRIHDELLPIAWHPDRVFDWCFDEWERGFLKEMWKS